VAVAFGVCAEELDACCSSIHVDGHQDAFRSLDYLETACRMMRLLLLLPPAADGVSGGRVRS
jgi:hypothetical protein